MVVPSHVLRLPVEGGTLAVERHGSGRPVVCVPGLGSLRSSWRALVPRLVAAGHCVYTLDLRGHGDSSVGFDRVGAEATAEDVVALLQSEDLRDVVLIGNSIGGAAVCLAAVLAPERVGALVLVNPFVRDMPVERWFRPLVPLLFARPWGTWAWGRYRRTLLVTRLDDADAEDAALAANLAEPARLAAVRGMLRATKAPVTARLHEVAAPALVLMGASDPDYTDPEAEGHTVAGLLGGAATVACIAETGHYPQEERPDATAAAILGFLEAHGGA